MLGMGKKLLERLLGIRKTTFPKIAIYGQYKTGTTACFLKIRDSLNCVPRELFEQPEYIPESEDNTHPVLAKVIIPPKLENYLKNVSSEDTPQALRQRAEAGINSFQCFDKHILLIRDPRDWLISWALFTPQGKKEIYNNEFVLSKILALLRKKEESPLEISFLKIFSEILATVNQSAEIEIPIMISGQHDFFYKFERNLNNYVRWSYEDMIMNKSADVEKYLGFKITNSPKPDIRFKHVARSMKSGNWKDWFTPEDVIFFKPLVTPYLKLYGYPDDWNLKSNPRIVPDHTSLYVERTVAMKRELENIG